MVIPEVIDERLGASIGLVSNTLFVDKVLLVEKVLLPAALARRSTVHSGDVERDQTGVSGAELELSLGLSKSSRAGGSWTLSTSKESRVGVREGSEAAPNPGVISLPGAVRRLASEREDFFFAGGDCDGGVCEETTISGKTSALSSEGACSVVAGARTVWLSPFP